MSEHKQLNLNFVSTNTSSTFIWPYSKNVRSANFVKTEEGNFIEIIYEETSTYTLTTSTSILPPIVKMIKEIYGVVDGKLQLIKRIEGKEIQGYYVPPSIEWNE